MHLCRNPTGQGEVKCKPPSPQEVWLNIRIYVFSYNFIVCLYNVVQLFVYKIINAESFPIYNRIY